MALFENDDSARRQHRYSSRQLLDRVWCVQWYHERGVRRRREFFCEPIGRKVVTKRRIDIIKTAWNEAPKAHAVNNTLAVFEDADPHPRKIPTFRYS